MEKCYKIIEDVFVSNEKQGTLKRTAKLRMTFKMILSNIEFLVLTWRLLH